MSKIDKLNSYHRINNFPKKFPAYKRLLSQAVFVFLITKLTGRPNYLEEADLVLATEAIQPGDLVLAGGFRSVSGIFMGKIFTHSLLYIGGGECIHADADGVDILPFNELFTAYDTLTILRPEIKGDREGALSKVIAFAKDQIGKPYDFYLEYGDDRYFCTRLISVAYASGGFDAGIELKEKVRRDFFSIFSRIRRVAKADDFLRGDFQTVFISKSAKRKHKEIERLKKQNK
jgi:hypothetical protein